MAGFLNPDVGIPRLEIPLPSYSRMKSHVGHASCKLLLTDLEQNLNVSTNTGKAPQYQISRKSDQPASSYYLRSDGRTKKIQQALHNVGNAPKKSIVI
jgi:hypothetical protein